MKYIIMFDGSIGSAVALDIIVTAYDRKDVILLDYQFNDCFQDLERFKRDVARHFNMPVTVVEAPENIYHHLKHHGCDNCDILVNCQYPDAFIIHNQSCVVVYGYTVEIPIRRVMRDDDHWKSMNVPTLFPLIETKWDYALVCKQLSQYGIRVPDAALFDPGRCVPCVIGSKAYFGRMLFDDSDIYDKLIALEKESNNIFPSTLSNLGLINNMKSDYCDYQKLQRRFSEMGVHKSMCYECDCK